VWVVLVWAYVLFLCGPAFRADFGVIDDHVIMEFLGTEGKLALADVPRHMNEGLFWGGRFRPAHIAVWTVETYFYQNHAWRWFLSRFVLEIITATALYLAARKVLPPFAATVPALLFFSGPQTEIWYHLGHAEALATPLVALGLLLIVGRAVRGAAQPLHCVVGFLLLLASGFVKESYIPLLPAVLAFVYLVLPAAGALPWPRLTRGDVAVLVALGLGVAGQVGGVLFALEAYGHIYSGHWSVAQTLLSAKQSLGSFAHHTWWFLPALACLGLMLYRRESVRRWLALAAWLVVGAFLILVPQWIFYGSNTGGMAVYRYLTPANWFVVYAVTVGLWHLLDREGRPEASVQPWGKISAAICLCLVCLAFYQGGRIRHTADSYARNTRQFQAALTEIVELKKQHPAAPIVFRVHEPDDSERVRSVHQFLATRLHREETEYVEVTGWDAPPRNELNRRLVRDLETTARDGGDGFGSSAALAAEPTARIEVLFSNAPKSGQAGDVVLLNSR
jgi:hypothetical protein